MLVSSSAIGGERLTLNFNPDWKFIKADPAGAAAPDFDDSAWTTVSAPHTYNDIDTFDDWSHSRPSSASRTSGADGPGIARHSTCRSHIKGKRFTSNSRAFARWPRFISTAQLLGVSKTGFIPFGFDLTPHLRFGAPNVLAVMCDNRFMKDPVGKARPHRRQASRQLRTRKKTPERI